LSELSTALVAGATGHTGSRLVELFESRDDWRVIGVSRRASPTWRRVEHIGVDLTDAAAANEALARAPDVTHIFYCARAPHGESGVESVADNLAMLAHVVDAVETTSPALKHVHLIEEGKWYGVHLGPYPTPAREDDPRHLPPNFYYDQEDLLRLRQERSGWTWSASRPHFIYDYSPERPRNIVSTIGAWAAMCAEHGTPLDFPGSPACYSALMEITDATQLARAMAWMATSERARNQAYNVTDSCQFRWQGLWPRIAAHFNLPVGDVRPLKLAEWMKDKEPAWKRIVERHSLAPNPMQEIASWAFADFFWGLDHDNFTDTTKIRLHGFHGVVDTGQQILDYLQRYREARLLP